jgi:hypothetical protein
VLNDRVTFILASNRRVDFTLSNAGQASQESVRQYSLNAAVSLTLVYPNGGAFDESGTPSFRRLRICPQMLNSRSAGPGFAAQRGSARLSASTYAILV